MTPATLRVLAPAPGVFAYYDGRVPGHRFLPGPNWVDDGAIGLGVSSYALTSGDQALVYDTHVSPDHARSIRSHLESLGITRFTVVLSHWHLDHVAGTEVFEDNPVLSSARTRTHLASRKAAIEDASLKGPPAISPLILPNETYSGRRTFMLGTRRIELIETEIHSDDATVLWLPEEGLLLAGDTLEDSLTFVSEPDRIVAHLEGLAGLAGLSPRRILPAHGSPEVIAQGGYGPGMIAAAEAYTRHLIACRTDAAFRARPAQEILAPWIASGDVVWFEPYAEVHQMNLARVTG